MSETKAVQVSVTQYLNQPAVLRNIEQTLGSKSHQFIASVSSLVNNNKMLAEADKKSLLSSCLIAASLDLPINQNLGFAYIIPYRNNNTGITEAQFQMGWKGFVQLGQRSGLYKTMNVTDVKESEIVGRNRLTGELDFNWVDDDAERKKQTTVGFIAYFELLNGFRKNLYMTTEELQAHAKQYSQAYRSNKGMNKWRDDFDAMAKKTVLKLLISKYGPMTVEMQKAIVMDQAVDDDGQPDYIDNQGSELGDRLDEAKKEGEGMKMGNLTGKNEETTSNNN